VRALVLSLLALLAASGASAQAAESIVLAGPLPPAVNSDGTINALIEIPAGTNAKWETTKDLRSIDWERRDDGSLRVVRYLAYPGNYGMVPGTLLAEEDGGDGDPLDVLVLGTALDRGRVVRVHAIGLLALLDDGEIDDKVLAVPTSGPFSQVRSLADLDRSFPGVRAILETWFTHYKGPGRVESKGFRERDAALAVLRRATLSQP